MTSCVAACSSPRWSSLPAQLRRLRGAEPTAAVAGRGPGGGQGDPRRDARRARAAQTKKLPPGSTASSGRTARHPPPAFEGTLKVAASGVSVDVAGGRGRRHRLREAPVHHRLRRRSTRRLRRPRPGGPDGPDGGPLVAAHRGRGPEQGEAQRAGDEVVTTYTGTLPGCRRGRGHPDRGRRQRLRRHVHRQRRRRAEPGGAHRPVLPPGRRRDLHRHVRRVRHAKEITAP